MGWRLAESLKHLFAEANLAAPNRNKASDGSIGDQAHAGTVSDHNPDANGIVHAIDITHDPKNGWDCAARTEALRLKKDPRIKYMIFGGRFCRSYDKPGIPAWTWSREKDWGHYKHMHVSILSGAAETDLRPWFGEEDELAGEAKVIVAELAQNEQRVMRIEQRQQRIEKRQEEADKKLDEILALLKK